MSLTIDLQLLPTHDLSREMIQRDRLISGFTLRVYPPELAWADRSAPESPTTTQLWPTSGLNPAFSAGNQIGDSERLRRHRPSGYYARTLFFFKLLPWGSYTAYNTSLLPLAALAKRHLLSHQFAVKPALLAAVSALFLPLNLHDAPPLL
ncbi:uncharacterized protein EI90DRAFT_1766756 [Cantharellus anzutake]|uniref:uncharacterized protein n=1 Tax=Cantharellus anzutake TaxID=1750568 RepID=UPI001907748B|nr:uncharacterized protein EI90DRAFT_1766756 [Cantharellus anzutake]KAF8327565.1 hypothetical protein EI90DRAFT_1766756 [Cantharellus anzutake]